jgi:hypothetical protein
MLGRECEDPRGAASAAAAGGRLTDNGLMHARNGSTNRQETPEEIA